MLSENLALTLILFMGIVIGAFVSPLLTSLKRAGKIPVFMVNPRTKDIVDKWLPAGSGFLEIKGPKGEEASIPLEGSMAHNYKGRKAFMVDTMEKLPFSLEEGKARRLDGRRLWAIRHSTKLRKISESNSDDRAALAKMALVALVIVLIGIGVAIWMLAKLLQRGGEAAIVS